jgi:hypothetical protein
MYQANTIMEYKGFRAKIMEAERLSGDHIFGLPPGSPLNVYPSGVFLEYPEQWMKGPGVFVVPVKPNKGLWFDWTLNSSVNTAVLPTVKGCNPITGMPTSGFRLERYVDKCPKHGVEFESDRYCPKCDYKWAKQNYVTGSPMWWDGFRSEDGSVRQFFFTEDEIRDVASHMIGKENTVPAFGFAFYRQKILRAGMFEIHTKYDYEEKYKNPLKDMWYLSNTNNYGVYSDTKSTSSGRYFANSGNILCCSGLSSPQVCTSRSAHGNSYLGKVEEDHTTTSYSVQTDSVKEVSIGAGAKIKQELNEDKYEFDSWEDSPAASMVIYFVFQEKLDKMISKGIKDLNGVKEGMLNGIPVG